jgi:hypothetical protein
VREGVRSKRGSTKNYKIANYAGDDRNHCSSLEGMLHELVPKDI